MNLVLRGSRILVLGLGETGWSMTRWLAGQGARVRVADSRDSPPHAVRVREQLPEVDVRTGPFDAQTFAAIDAIAISPGIDRREPLVAAAIEHGTPVVGDVELFAQSMTRRCAPQERPAILAITGSNGKSTVTAMAGDMCRAAGRRTVVAGNIGLPILDAWSEIEAGAPMPDVFVLELSSFQLESTQTLEPTAATMLNVSEDHMDRYDGMADYAAAKARIFAGNGLQVLNRDDRWSMGMRLPGRACVTFGLDAPPSDGDWGVRDGDVLAHGSERVIGVDELTVTGMHNAANALAALALTDAIRVPREAAARALRSFRGLPHRVEHVADVRGIAFYDDSKGTNVGSTVAALQGMRQPTVLIAGGDGKGQNFAPLAPAVAGRARAVVLIGRDAPLLRRAIADCGVPILEASDMDGAVDTAYRAARRGDVVLLSPACASYDMFRNYGHRAEVFVAAVRALAQREG
ncbi:MAG: UDP-N-acetylmuramoyl-L-alanine--D-glutamate ligase [Rhodospirillaceae bacterium]